MTITAAYGFLAPIPGGRVVFGAAMVVRIAWRELRLRALYALSLLPGPVSRWSRHQSAAVLRRWRADVAEMEAIAERLD